MTQWQMMTISMDRKYKSLLDSLTYYLFEMGAQGTQIEGADYYLETEDLYGEIRSQGPEESKEPLQVKAFFEPTITPDYIQSQLQAMLQVPVQIQSQVIKEENWQANWMSHYELQTISRFIKIVPAWQDYQSNYPDERIIFLNPGLSFGTGNHTTTRLSGQALELFMQGGERVIDVGTGSGILSLIAWSLGAKQVWGYDLDPQAIQAATDNLAIHQAKTGQNIAVEFQVNNLLSGVEQTAEIIVANILPHILKELIPQAGSLLTENGYLILGGILEEKAKDLIDYLEESGWKVCQKTSAEGWANLVVQKKED